MVGLAWLLGFIPFEAGRNHGKKTPSLVLLFSLRTRHRRDRSPLDIDSARRGLSPAGIQTGIPHRNLVALVSQSSSHTTNAEHHDGQHQQPQPVGCI